MIFFQLWPLFRFLPITVCSVVTINVRPTEMETQSVHAAKTAPDCVTQSDSNPKLIRSYTKAAIVFFAQISKYLEQTAIGEIHYLSFQRKYSWANFKQIQHFFQKNSLEYGWVISMRFSQEWTKTFNVKDFLENNRRHPSIKFTHKKEINGVLSFLKEIQWKTT